MMIWEYEIWVWWFVKFGFCFFWFLIMMITWLIMVVLVFLDFICMRMNADWVLNYLFFYNRWNPSAKRFCGISLFASLLFKCLRNSNFFSPTNLPRKRMLLRWKEFLLLLGRGLFYHRKFFFFLFSRIRCTIKLPFGCSCRMMRGFCRGKGNCVTFFLQFTAVILFGGKLFFSLSKS